MMKELTLSIEASKADDMPTLMKAAQAMVSFEISSMRIIKRSIDARQDLVKCNMLVLVYDKHEALPAIFSPRHFPIVTSNKRKVVIAGAGPAGLFAALKLIEQGIKPIIIERGKDVQARRRDLVAIHKQHIINPDSNYCFGEGGAGTYSDGKLYTRSTKRGDVRSVLETLVQFGADQNILVDAHPHIGTNKLPKIIAAMREQILRCGGEVHFNTRWADVLTMDGKIEKLIMSNGESMEADAYVMATGHSARDVFQLLNYNNILIEFKPFAMGVRAEHMQSIIDIAQYRCQPRPEYLPPAAYSLVHQATGRGVYSFCMCPGGIIAPCATVQGEVVTNGWSPSKRNNKWANSGVVVPVEWDDIAEYHQHGPLAGMYFQKAVEEKCCAAAGHSQAAPAQRLIDFVQNKISENLPECSYQPGIVSCNLNEILPPFIAERLRQGFIAFGKKMKGYYTNEAVLVATESRTSSPVRVPRDKVTLAHPQLSNFYPCGEGAGYAGGIVSAAIDGEKVAAAIVQSMQ
ncbi:MAG: NAD(P)/FAD-dependent oxidoreductase [Flavobacteriales bacterium]